MNNININNFNNNNNYYKSSNRFYYKIIKIIKNLIMNNN
jgi:hypothetical protein